MLNFFEMIIEALKCLNIVEWWKAFFLFVKIGYSQGDPEECRKIKGQAIDIFIISKYVLLFYLWNSQNEIYKYFVWYMLISNVFTYFYYHVWEMRIRDREHSKRRFMTFILAMTYSCLSFMILYKNFYFNEFNSVPKLSNTIKAFSLSFGAFFNANSIEALTDSGYVILTINSMVNFIFLTFILANTNIHKRSD